VRGGPSLLRFRTDNGLQVWVNHEAAAHDNRIYRHARLKELAVPVRLRKGDNPCLVKVTTMGGKWGFRLHQIEVKGRLYVSEEEVLIPDLRTGERLDGFGSIALTNLSEKTLRDAEIHVLADTLVQPAETEVSPIAPRQTVRAPFRIRLRRALRPGEHPLLKVIVKTDGEEKRLTLWPKLRVRGEYFTTTFRSGLDGSVQPLSILLPKGFDPAKRYPLVLALHGGNVPDEFHIKGYTIKDWCIIASPYGRGSTRYRDAGEVDVFEALAHVKKHFPVDEDRIYLTGHSQGGYGTWKLGLQNPHLFAALAPLSAVSDYFPRRSGRIGRLRGNPERLRMEKVLFRETRPFFFLDNARHLPIFCTHGSADRVVRPEQTRRMVKAAGEKGIAIEYREIPGAGHWWGQRGKNRGAECVDMTPIFRFFKGERRMQRPRSFAYVTCNLKHSRAYWVKIEGVHTPWVMARVEADTPATNRMVLKTVNISRLNIRCREAPVNPEKPLRIAINGVDAFSGPIPADGSIPFALDEKGVPTPARPKRDLTKRPGLFGPYADAFNSPFILVYGTSGSDATAIASSYRTARLESMKWSQWANGNGILKADRDITPEDIAKFNLVLFGGPRSNRLTARVMDRLPIRIEGSAIVAGKKRWKGKHLAVRLIYPNPLNPNRYIALNAGTTSRGTELTRLLERELPDYVIFDERITEAGWAGFLKAGFFDSKWRFE
jgi:poly(3-hydroxybutyrate) depolymerase